MLRYISDLFYTQHLTGLGHLEQPARTVIIHKALEHAGLLTQENLLTPRMATEEEILLCHTPSYLQIAKQEIGQLQEHQLTQLSTGDVMISSQSYDAALLAAGGTLTAVDHVMQQKGNRAFAIVRPPGHHACSDRGMGFCIFNNIAIAARYAQKKHGIKRVLIADWDVHHGNGTQEIFYSDPSVFYFSTHEKGLYPQTGYEEETGAGAGIGITLNCPIEPTSNARIEVIEAFRSLLVDRMKTFKPELVLISAGFDAHKNDPLGHFNLTDQDFYSITQILNEIADEHAQSRIVSALEGGYHLPALATSTIAHAQALNNEKYHASSR